MRVRIALLIVMSELAGALAGGAPVDQGPLARQYKEGESMNYCMKGINGYWRYEVQAAGIVKRDSTGKYVEEYAWSHLVSDGAAVALPPAGVQFRQMVSLDPEKPPSLPDLSAAPPVLIGPITDLATFYVDLWLATRLGNKLDRAGDHADVKVGIPASWADGKRVVIGQDAVDFDISLLEIDRSAQTATLLVKHVPPVQPRVPLPASWMREPIAGTPNNWVQVERKGEELVAGVGKETFDVRMKVSLLDGKILSATMENLVIAQERDCRDTALTACGNPRPLQISRHIEISLKD